MDRLWKFFYTAFAKPFIKRRLRKKNTFAYAGIDIVVFPGVFHPGYFFSSLFFADFIYETDMRGKTFCEVGVGTGLVSLLAYRNGAEIYSFDVNEIAVENADENFDLNFSRREPSKFHLYKSDLFDDFPEVKPDYMFINPPYFFRDAKTDSQKAWYCGREGNYFKKLFYQLPEFTHDQTQIFMVLAESTDVMRIRSMAENFGYQLEVIEKRKVKWEWNYIFRLNRI
jgi:release factor glutamine methyltransferase